MRFAEPKKTTKQRQDNEYGNLNHIGQGRAGYSL